MSNERPSSDNYGKWLRDVHAVRLEVERSRYEVVAQQMLVQFQGSQFWRQFVASLEEWGAQYQIRTSYDLLMRPDLPPLCIKPFGSFVDKTYRRNVLDNRQWPLEPNGGWVIPDGWYSRIGDVIRTTLVVKYLDGVGFVADALKALGISVGLRCECHMEARDEGYYAAHLYVPTEFEVTGRQWDTYRFNGRCELQITTQLQEVIRRMLHHDYEAARMRSRHHEPDVPWQWDFHGDAFTRNSLGHMLHYMEAMILRARVEQGGE